MYTPHTAADADKAIRKAVIMLAEIMGTALCLLGSKKAMCWDNYETADDIITPN